MFSPSYLDNVFLTIATRSGKIELQLVMLDYLSKSKVLYRKKHIPLSLDILEIFGRFVAASSTPKHLTNVKKHVFYCFVHQFILLFSPIKTPVVSPKKFQ